MAKNEKTSKTVGRKASKILRDPKSSKDAKSVAGSTLTQRPDRKGESGEARGSTLLTISAWRKIRRPYLVGKPESHLAIGSKRAVTFS